MANSLIEILGLIGLNFVLIGAVLAGAFKIFGTAIIDKAVQHRLDKSLEDYRWRQNSREQSVKIAEYMSLRFSMSDSSSDEYFNRANQLAWELFLWLPADVWRELMKAQKPGGNYTDALIRAREYLLQEEKSSLGPDDMVRHGRSNELRGL